MSLDLKPLKKEAGDRKTSAARLLELASMDVQLSRSVAKSKHAPAQVLEYLARSSDMTTRRAVAANPTIPLALMEKLARDNQWTVLKAVATNASTPPHLLKHLASHSRDTVRHALFQRDFVPLPDEVLETFVHSPHVEDRRLLTRYGHPLPQHVLQQLERDPDTQVRLNLVWLQGGKLGDDLLQECLQSQDPQLRWTAAKHTTSAETLAALLLNDPDIGVKCAAARNHHTPGSALVSAAESLLAHPGDADDVKALLVSLLHNSGTPKAMKTELRQKLHRPLKTLVNAELVLKGETP